MGGVTFPQIGIRINFFGGKKTNSVCFFFFFRGFIDCVTTELAKPQSYYLAELNLNEGIRRVVLFDWIKVGTRRYDAGPASYIKRDKT